MYGIAAAMPRVVQFDYFQFEDKFNNPADLRGGMSIVRDDGSVKAGYNAYKTAARMLDGATLAGDRPADDPRPVIPISRTPRTSSVSTTASPARGPTPAHGVACQRHP